MSSRAGRIQHPPCPRPPSSRVRLDAQVIVHGAPELLLAAKVPLGRLNRHVAQEKLDLVQFPAVQPYGHRRDEWTVPAAGAVAPAVGAPQAPPPGLSL